MIEAVPECLQDLETDRPGPCPRLRPRPRLRLGRVAFVLAVLAALVLWLLRPIVPRAIGKYPASGEACWVRRLGFLAPADDAFTTPRAGTVVFRSWQGQTRWSVQLPAADPSGWQAPTASWSGRAFALDPSGRFAAAACAEDSQIRVMSWRDGRPLGEVRISAPAREAFDLQATADGRVLLWFSGAHISPVWLIQGHAVLAVGEHHAREDRGPGEHYTRRIAPDGETLIGYLRTPAGRDRVEYHRLRRDGRSLRVRYHRTLTRFRDPVLFDDAVLGARSGVIYGTRGTVAGRDAWRLAEHTPPTPWCAVQTAGKYARVIYPSTGDAWGLPRPGAHWRVGVSPDGHYAVTFDHDARPVPDLLAALPLSLYLSQRRLHLYTRPGTHLATLTLPAAGPAPEHANLSPDGRTLLLHTVNPADGTGTFSLYAVPAKR